MKLRALVLVAALLGGCESCSGETLATVSGTQGSVERDHAADEERWEPAEVGAGLSFGDGLRTGAEARAVLTLRGGGQVRVGPSAQIRLGRAGAERLALDVLTGEIELETEHAMRVETELGALTVEPGGRARIRADGLEVLVGSVRLEQDGEARTVEAGETFSLELGRIALEEELPSAAAAPPELDREPEGWRVRGDGEVRLQSGEAWTALAPGEVRLAHGATVSVEAGRANLARGADTVDLSAASRAQVGGGGAIALQRGSARVHALEEAVVVEVPGGVIVVRGDGGLAQITADEEGARVEAERGEVRVRRDGEEETVAPGRSVRVRREAEAPESSIATADPPEVRVRAGESFSVHTPRLPAIVEMSAPARCGGEAVLELAGRRNARASETDGALRMRLPAGGHRYLIRCHAGGPVVARGRMRVVRDSAMAPLPRTPPSTVVDADGRRYTILYQNLLPEVRVRAVGAAPLEVTSRGRSPRRFRPSGGVVSLPSGTLDEGSHSLRFVGASDPPTTVAVRFDNAARTIALRQPPDRSFSAGERVPVSGVTLRGWNVSVEGHAIAQDRSHRFSDTIEVPAGRGGFAVRLAHPRRGVRYYVRRVREVD